MCVKWEQITGVFEHTWFFIFLYFKVITSFERLFWPNLRTKFISMFDMGSWTFQNFLFLWNKEKLKIRCVQIPPLSAPIWHTCFFENNCGKIESRYLTTPHLANFFWISYILRKFHWFCTNWPASYTFRGGT